jgi:lysozyme family protein
MKAQTIHDIISNIVIRESSKYTNDPTDPGGPTKFGITLKTLRGVRQNQRLTAEAVKALTRADAWVIYETNYIRAPGFDKIHSDRLARLLIDTGVLHGQRTAIKMLQRVVQVTADGKIGPKTLDAVRRSNKILYHEVIKLRVNREIEKVLADVKAKFGPNVRKTTKLKYLRGWVVGRTLKEFL